jgi:glycyl-tRNA synthetase alpha chain
MYLQEVESVFDIMWNKDIRYGEIHHETELEFSKYNFDFADIDMHLKLFELFENECKRLLNDNLIFPAYDFCLKCSHTFNMLDARGSLSVTERTSYIARVRALAKRCAEGYLKLHNWMVKDLSEKEK